MVCLIHITMIGIKNFKKTGGQVFLLELVNFIILTGIIAGFASLITKYVNVIDLVSLQENITKLVLFYIAMLILIFTNWSIFKTLIWCKILNKKIEVKTILKMSLIYIIFGIVSIIILGVLGLILTSLINIKINTTIYVIFTIGIILPIIIFTILYFNRIIINYLNKKRLFSIPKKSWIAAVYIISTIFFIVGIFFNWLQIAWLDSISIILLFTYVKYLSVELK